MAKKHPAVQSTPSLHESLEEYGRGFSGGLIFSLPLLYTMEVWFTGEDASPLKLLVAFSFTFVLLLGYNRYAGMRADSSWAEVAIDSIEEMGIGLLLATVLLWLLGRITGEMAANEVCGKIILEAICVAIGVSVGTAQLGGSKNDVGFVGDEDAKGHDSASSPHRILSEMTLAFCGAVLVATNVAPTEEVFLLAAEMSPAKVLGLMIFSLGMCGLIQFFSGFHGSHRYASMNWGQASMSVLLGYATALLTSAGLLWFFDSSGNVSMRMHLSQIVVLGLPASLGAAAGRLLLVTNEN